MNLVILYHRIEINFHSFIQTHFFHNSLENLLRKLYFNIDNNLEQCIGQNNF